LSSPRGHNPYTGASRLAGFHEVRIDDLQPEAIEGFLGHWSRALFPGDERSAESHLEQLREGLTARMAIRRSDSQTVTFH